MSNLNVFLLGMTLIGFGVLVGFFIIWKIQGHEKLGTMFRKIYVRGRLKDVKKW